MTFEGSFKERKKVSLKVQDPDPTHVGRNIVTLDRKTKEELGITSGDLVEIQGTKKTAAVVWPARAEDEGKATIRMDNLIRHNCGVGLGEKVEVAKAEYKDAKKVVLAPTQDVRIIATGYDRVLKKTFIGRPLTKGDRVWITVFGSGFIYAVVDTNPRGIVKITDFTQFVLKEEPIKETMEAIPKIAYEDIGGLEEQVQKVREMIELPMRHPELFRRLGISPPKGVLLHGPPGTGKTLLAKAVANETNAHFISVSGPSIMSKFVGEAEERIRQIFKEAEENSPSIIFIDELDSIAPKREEAVGEVERRVVAQLLALMDGMEARGNVIVIAATNRVNALDEALRRPGRFDREIEIGVPDKNGRKAILQVHSRGMPLVKFDQLDKEIMKEMEKLEGSERIDNQTSSEKNDDERLKKIKNKLVEFAIKELQKDYSHIKIESIIRAMADSDLEKIVKAKEANLSGILSEISKQRSNEEVDINHYAQITHGFVGADLAALVKEAAMKALRRYLPEINLEEETIPPEVLEKLEVKKDDFDEALKDVQPSALREVMVEIPNIRWTDIGGLEEVKEELKQVVEWPIKFPEVFTKMGIKPPTGILLYGPPGTGKTLLAKAIANESEANFISIKGPELLSKFVGESEKGVRKIFRKARQVSPVVVFFDEIDSLATIRNGSEFDSGVGDRVANQLLTELDGVESLNGVIFIAATNRPDLIDPALLRPGRIDKIIIVGAPDEKAREEIFKVHLKGVPLAKNFNLKEILQKTKGYTGADIQGLVREAVLMTLKESKMKPADVQNKHFEQAMEKILPSLTEETEDNYAQFRKKMTEVKLSYVG